jgi:hypothetical protein
MGSQLQPQKQPHGLVLPAESRDAVRMSPWLREADRLELRAHGQDDAYIALEFSIRASEKCYTVWVDDVPAAIFGVALLSEDPRVGSIWLLGTPKIETIKIQFLRESRKWLEDVSQGYDLLTNVVHEDNELHIRWLRWLGMSFVARYSPFVEFAKICAL